jgi:hypothetical protein
MPLLPLTTPEIYKLILSICSIGLVISTLELLSVRKAFSADGAYSWPVFSAVLLRTRNATRDTLLSAIFDDHGVVALLAIRLIALFCMLFVPIYSLTFRVSLTLVIVSILLMTWRRSFGDDGADQMNTIVLITGWLCTAIIQSDLLLRAGLWFIALQAVLSYGTAGVAKLVSPIWRGGHAVAGVFSTGTYGLTAVAAFLRGRPILNYLLCWSVMVIETGFLVALFLPVPYATMFLVWGIVFHLLCAVIMGLNNFFWAFFSSYPAIVYAWWDMHTRLW